MVYEKISDSPLLSPKNTILLSAKIKFILIPNNCVQSQTSRLHLPLNITFSLYY